jgi:hypothetical protein
MKKTILLSLLIGVFIAGTITTLALANTEENGENNESKNGWPCYWPGYYKPQINRETEVIDNGIKITITSEDEETIEKLQCQEEGSITYTVTHIDNGIGIEITSNNERIVEKLQNWVDKYKFFFFGFSVPSFNSLFFSSECWAKIPKWVGEGFYGGFHRWSQPWWK